MEASDRSAGFGSASLTAEKTESLRCRSLPTGPITISCLVSSVNVGSMHERLDRRNGDFNALKVGANNRSGGERHPEPPGLKPGVTAAQ